MTTKKTFEHVAFLLKTARRLQADSHPHTVCIRVRLKWNNYLTSYRNHIINWLAAELADMFAENNPQFDRDKFIQACK